MKSFTKESRQVPSIFRLTKQSFDVYMHRISFVVCVVCRVYMQYPMCSMHKVYKRLQFPSLACSELPGRELRGLKCQEKTCQEKHSLMIIPVGKCKELAPLTALQLRVCCSRLKRMAERVGNPKKYRSVEVHVYVTVPTNSTSTVTYSTMIDSS